MSNRKPNEPPLIEPAKGFLFARGMHCSEITRNVMRDLARLKEQQGKTTTGKNDFHPMEDETGIERLCESKGAGLFAFGTENKKRPNNLILGRTYDRRLLDMVEVGITKFESMIDCQKRAKTTSASSFWAPLLLFQGEEFANAQEGSDLATFQNLLIDMFRAPPAKLLDLEAIDLALVFTCLEDKKVQMRGYRIAYTKSTRQGSPSIDLLEHGPNIDLQIRRFKAAAPNLAKLARRQPKLPGSGKTKNVSSDPLRGLVGQIHMHKQDTNKLVTRSRFKKALKRNVGTQDSNEKKKKFKKTVE
jgi:ribosome production factor 2